MVSGCQSAMRLRFWYTASAVPSYHPSRARICGGTILTKLRVNRPPICQLLRRCSIRDCERYWTRTYREVMDELTKLLRTKSMMRYFPPKGTAGLLRTSVSGRRRSPLPPAMIIPRTRWGFIASLGGGLGLVNARYQLRDGLLTRFSPCRTRHSPFASSLEKVEPGSWGIPQYASNNLAAKMQRLDKQEG